MLFIKKCVIIEARPVIYPSHFGTLAISNDLPRNTLTKAVFSINFKNLYKPYDAESKLCLIRFDKPILNLLFL